MAILAQPLGPIARRGHLRKGEHYLPETRRALSGCGKVGGGTPAICKISSRLSASTMTAAAVAAAIVRRPFA
jgi:hypothetical protein